MNLWKEQELDAQHIQDAVEGGEDFKASEAHECEYEFVHGDDTFVCKECDKECHHCAINWLPQHRASMRCRSGGYNHCTCDTCF